MMIFKMYLRLQILRHFGVSMLVFGGVYMVQHRPPPPLWMGHGPPPLWLWGCGGALLVSDAADFLWFLVPPPPHGPPCGVGNGGVVVVVVVVVVEVVVVVVIW